MSREAGVRVCPCTDVQCSTPSQCMRHPLYCVRARVPDPFDWWAELRKVEAELKARGVRDIKFTWSPDIHMRPADEVARDVVIFIRAYLDGRFTRILKIGDSHGLRQETERPKCPTCKGTGWIITSYPKELDGSGEPFEVSCPDCNDATHELLD